MYYFFGCISALLTLVCLFGGFVVPDHYKLGTFYTFLVRVFWLIPLITTYKIFTEPPPSQKIRLAGETQTVPKEEDSSKRSAAA